MSSSGKRCRSIFENTAVYAGFSSTDGDSFLQPADTYLFPPKYS
jgi:hypothetical protein